MCHIFQLQTYFLKTNYNSQGEHEPHISHQPKRDRVLNGTQLIIENLP
jgi:hypothetical protein